MSKLEEKLQQPQESSAWMWTPLRMVAGSKVCWKRTKRQLKAQLSFWQSVHPDWHQTSLPWTRVVSPCPQVPAGIVSLLPFCKQPRGQARLSQPLTFISVATTELSKPCPDQLFSPQTSDHGSEFTFWMFSQMNMPVTFSRGLKNSFQPIFPYHHTLLWRCLSRIYMVTLHIPSPHQEWYCTRTFQLF